MPLHGLEADLELAVLVIGSAIISYLIEGAIVSNYLFAGLLAGLFFLMGTHLEHFNPRKKEVLTGLASVYLTGLLIGGAFYLLGFGPVMIALGLSAASIGSPSIWSNLSSADGNLASEVSSAAVVSSILLIPSISLLLPIQFNFTPIHVAIAYIPMVAGYLLKTSSFEYVQEVRVHFSKLSLFLILLITGIQTQMLIESGAFISVISIVGKASVFAVFFMTCFLASYPVSRLLGFNIKQSRAIAFSSSSKNVAIGFLLASMISPEAVASVGIYYAVRQLMGVGTVDFFDEEADIAQRLGL
ncbi:MAG: hypothetical protein H8Z69_05795 [Nanohaloarchaea archaeon]|nr:hypothetical protein [Candidatus Nanohaloarchaea archaeon]